MIRRSLPQPTVVAGVRIVDSTIAKQTEEFARRAYDPYLYNHAVRAFLFGSLIGKAMHVKWDEELVFQARVRAILRRCRSAIPGICRVHRAELLRLRGSWSEAEVEARRASTELQDFLSDVAAEAYYELGQIRLLMGDLDTADDLFRQAHELGRDPVPGLALLRLAQGRTENARALLDRALSDPLLSRLDRARLLPGRAEVAFALSDTETARAAAAELTSIAEAYGSPALAARAAFARGLVELGEWQPAIAAATLRRAWKLSKDSDLPYEAARSRVRLAQAYQACGNREDAELELHAAVSSFERLGAAADARSTVALLQR